MCAKQSSSPGMGYIPENGLDSLAYSMATYQPPDNQPPTVNIGGRNILDVSKSQQQNRVIQPLQQLATQYFQQQQMQKGKQFLNEVHKVMSSNLTPEDRVNNLQSLKAQYGTDFGLGLDDIINQQVELKKAGGSEVSQQRQDRLLKQNDFNNAAKLRYEFNNNQITKDFNTLNRSFKSITNAFLTSTNKDTKSRIASDQALAVMIQKMLDPASVVRESEYDRTPQGAAIINQLSSIVPQLQRGGLRLQDSDRKAIVDMAQQLLDAGGEVYNQHYNRYLDLAGETGIDPNKVFGGLKPYSKDGMATTQGQSGGIQIPENITKASEALAYLVKQGMNPNDARTYLQQLMSQQ